MTKRDENLKVCDFEKKGNVIRLYLTDEDIADVYIDDSKKRPYEHNAGTVSEEVYPYIELAFPLKIWVTEPADDWHYNGNSPYSKDDFKNRKAPCLLIGDLGDDWQDEYSIQLGNTNLLHIYYGDKLSDILQEIEKYNGMTLYRHYTNIIKEHTNGKG